MIKNLTPHRISIMVGDRKIDFESEGIARVASTSTVVGQYFGVPITAHELGEVEGLPDKESDVIYIVSGMVLDALKGSRNDVVSPDTTTGVIRNDKGQVEAVTMLRRR